MTDLSPDQLRAQYNVLTSAAAGLLFNGSTELSEQIQRGANMLYVAANQLEAVRQEVSDYAGWYEDSPEDSWRFERDLRTALGMKQYDEDDDA